MDSFSVVFVHDLHDCSHFGLRCVSSKHTNTDKINTRKQIFQARNKLKSQQAAAEQNKINFKLFRGSSPQTADNRIKLAELVESSMTSNTQLNHSTSHTTGFPTGPQVHHFFVDGSGSREGEVAGLRQTLP